MSPEMLAKLPERLRFRYIAALPEIQEFRRLGQKQRDHLLLNPLVEHNALTREMHAVEWEVLQHLVPDLRARDPQVKLKAIKWLCRQDWGKDFAASPYEQRYWSGHDLSRIA